MNLYNVSLQKARAIVKENRRGTNLIVQCDKCRTKYRVADEKVTDKGVRVRCAKIGRAHV